MEDKLKVSLIYPGISVKERYGRDIGDIGGKQAPLGLLYISSYLKSKGFETQVIDAEALRLSDEVVIEQLAVFSPDAIAISMTTVAFANALKLAHSVHVAFPEVPVIAGGPHVTANPKQTMECGEFDVGVLKEGEETLVELLNAIIADCSNAPEKRESDFKNKIIKGHACRARKKLSEAIADIKGIAFRDADGKVIITEKREYIQDIDKLPYPDRDALSDISLYRPPVGCYQEEFSVSMITSRGCPYRCIFCDNNIFGRKIRWFSSEYVVDEIEHVIKKYGAKEISFVDDTFPANRKRFIKILELIKERNLRFVWTCMANVNDLDDEVLQLMRETGCWQIALGIESGDNEILENVGPQPKVELPEITSVNLQTPATLTQKSSLSPAKIKIVKANFLKALTSLGKENYVVARDAAKLVLNSEIDINDKLWQRAAEILGKANIGIYMSDVPAPEKKLYTIKSGDNLISIAKRFSTTVESIQKSNGMDPTNPIILPGKTLYIYTGKWSIKVIKSHFRLYLYDGNQLFKVYKIGIGRQGRTPTGTFKITTKQKEPVWYNNGRSIAYGDKENVLGTRWMAITPTGDTDKNLSGYGIHGTWMPETISTESSNGCIRMINEEVNELYSILPYKTKVTIKD